MFQDFADTKDPRHQSYTEYSYKELLGTVFYKGIAGIKVSLRGDERKMDN